MKNKTTSLKADKRQTDCEFAHNALLDKGYDLIARKEKLGFSPIVSLVDFQNLLIHGNEEPMWISQFQSLQRDIRAYISKKSLFINATDKK